MEKRTTDKLLADSFKELALTIPIEKITIKEITDLAGVIRPTFYNHFQDKYELLEWIVKTELIEPVIPLIEGGFIREGITLIFDRMEKDKAFYTRAARLEGQNSFEVIIRGLIQDMLINYINSKVSPGQHFCNWMSADLIAEYYANCICFITIKWTLNDMSLPAAQLASLCEVVLENDLDEIISQMR